MTINPKYRWAGPHEWLQWARSRGLVTEVELFELIKTVDPDTIQDQLQSVMDECGYFTPINQSAITQAETLTKYHACPECDSTDIYEDDHMIICRDCGYEAPPEEWNDEDDNNKETD